MNARELSSLVVGGDGGDNDLQYLTSGEDFLIGEVANRWVDGSIYRTPIEEIHCSASSEDGT